MNKEALKTRNVEQSPTGKDLLGQFSYGSRATQFVEALTFGHTGSTAVKNGHQAVQVPGHSARPTGVGFCCS
jgi:hypothetical protein